MQSVVANNAAEGVRVDTFSAMSMWHVHTACCWIARCRWRHFAPSLPELILVKWLFGTVICTRDAGVAAQPPIAANIARHSHTAIATTT